MNHSSFTYRPKNAVTAILDQEALDQALSIPTDAGVDSTSVEVLSVRKAQKSLTSTGHTMACVPDSSGTSQSLGAQKTIYEITPLPWRRTARS